MMNLHRNTNCHNNNLPACALLAALVFLMVEGAVRADETSVTATTARTSPAWLRTGTMYEIFPRDFSTAGNLEGVTAQLDELHRLGVNILWTMPIHPIGETKRLGEFGSPYSIRDFYAVDPNYGTLADFQKLVAGAHHRGMKVIMDLVADHTAWDSVMMQHPEFYKHDAQGRIIPPVPEWRDVAALNYDNPGLRQYMIAMARYWIQTCDVDGFRCDAAGMVPTEFWEQARTELTKAKPNIILLAEASKPELLTNAFDLDYSWPMLGAEKDVLMRHAPASIIRQAWEHDRAQFPLGALHLRISDDHDEDRAVGRYGLDGALAASALVFTLDGVPLIYNGMETGDTAETSGGALFEKRNISWDLKEHPEVRRIYQYLIKLRQDYPALCNAKVDWIHNSDEASLVTFLRADRKDELLVAINFSKQAVTGKVALNDINGFVPLTIPGNPSSIPSPLPGIQLGPYKWSIYHRPGKLTGIEAGRAPGLN